MLNSFSELKELERKGFSLQEQWDELEKSPALLKKLGGNPRNIVQMEPAWKKKLKILDLKSNLYHTMEFVRREAIIELGKMGNNAKDLVPDLIQAFQDESAAIRYQAQFALTNIAKDSSVVVPALVEASISGGRQIRQWAKVTLNKVDSVSKAKWLKS